MLNKFALCSDGKPRVDAFTDEKDESGYASVVNASCGTFPKYMHAKLDQRWTSGTVVERWMASDQHVGVAGGEVVCARAIVRLVPIIRCD